MIAMPNIETRRDGARQVGTDYDMPDMEGLRCPRCNPDGMNRTGHEFLAHHAASTTLIYSRRCPYLCSNGLYPTTQKG